MRFYRYQNTPKPENRPSWHLYSRVVLDRPADEEGWSGYWWAWVIDAATGRPDYGEDYLVRSEDVTAAQAGEEIDVYLPGLCGTTSLSALHAYVEEQVGGVDSDAYVAVYEGELVTTVWDGVVFAPSRLVEIYPASELPKLAAEEEGGFHND